jgi:hypothetical protein
MMDYNLSCKLKFVMTIPTAANKQTNKDERKRRTTSNDLPELITKDYVDSCFYACHLDASTKLVYSIQCLPMLPICSLSLLPVPVDVLVLVLVFHLGIFSADDVVSLLLTSILLMANERICKTRSRDLDKPIKTNFKCIFRISSRWQPRKFAGHKLEILS